MLYIILCLFLLESLNLNVLEYRQLRRVAIDGSRKVEIIQNIHTCSSLSFFNKNEHKCVKCNGGRISGKFLHNLDKGCNGCSENYYLDFSSNDKIKYQCKKCSNNMLASTIQNHEITTCSIMNSYKLTDVLINGKIKSCKEIIKNSIQRVQNSPPFSNFCKCSNNLPKLYHLLNEVDMICLKLKKIKKIIDYRGLDYAIINNVEIDNIKYSYINCDPYRDGYNSVDKCLCPPGYIFIDFKCKLCILSEPQNPENYHQCVSCSSDRHLSLDGKKCMCPYSNKPQSANCTEPTNTDIHCSGNFGLVNGTCQLCPNNKIKSKFNDKCICPYSLYPVDEECKECNTKNINNKICKCGGDAILLDNICSCIINQIIDYDKNSINSTNETNNDIINKNPKTCSCPAGMVINANNECVDCPRGTYSHSNNSKKCLNCPLLKTTENSRSNSLDSCNRINKSQAIGLLMFILTILLLLIFSLVFWFQLRSDNKKMDNKQRNIESNHQYLNEQVKLRESCKNNLEEIRFKDNPSENQHKHYVNYQIAKETINNMQVNFDFNKKERQKNFNKLNRHNDSLKDQNKVSKKCEEKVKKNMEKISDSRKVKNDKTDSNSDHSYEECENPIVINSSKNKNKKNSNCFD
ncbi:MAG: hypothetical protein MHPSP_002009, partial [Paramarteilia canceri]